MSFAVRILISADADAVEAALWYDAQSPGLGAKFFEEIDLVVQRIKGNPGIYGFGFEDVRRAPLPRFRFYSIYYVLRNQEAFVIAVHHSRRNPRWLRDRRKSLG